MVEQILRYTIHLHLNHGESRYYLAKKFFSSAEEHLKPAIVRKLGIKPAVYVLVSNARFSMNTLHFSDI